jgi:glycosyltransferase involved in cell wall biosynthesis
MMMPAADRYARVLFVIDELVTPSAGTESQLLGLIEGLAGTRYEPHLAVFRTSDYVEQSVFPCPVHRLGLDQLASLRGLSGLAALTRVVRSLDARIAHLFFADAAVAAPFFCRMGGAQVIASRRDMGFWYTPGILRALKISNRFVSLIAANSEAVKRNVHQREGFPLERIAVVPNGHDLRRFDAPADPRVRDRFGIAADHRVIGMVANLYQRKRQFDLIRALPDIRRNCGPVHLVFAGAGEEAGSLRELAGSLDLGGFVHLVEDATEVVPIVKHFDVAVLCSESEGSSNAIIEYAFCARPIVCTNVGGNPELVQHQKSGLLVDCGDVEAIAAGITSLLRDEGLAARFGAAARQMAVRRYTKEAMLAEHLALYDAALAAGRPAQVA